MSCRRWDFTWATLETWLTEPTSSSCVPNTKVRLCCLGVAAAARVSPRENSRLYSSKKIRRTIHRKESLEICKHASWKSNFLIDVLVLSGLIQMISKLLLYSLNRWKPTGDDERASLQQRTRSQAVKFPFDYIRHRTAQGYKISVSVIFITPQHLFLFLRKRNHKIRHEVALFRSTSGIEPLVYIIILVKSF